MAKRRKKRKPEPLVYTIGEGGPLYLDMYVDASEVQIWINSPGMQFLELLFVTNLTHAVGYNAGALRSLAEEFDISSYCGHIGFEEVATQIRHQDYVPQLVIGVGSTGMYQNRLIMRTLSGDSFARVLTRRLTPGRRSVFSAGLVPIQTAQGHGQMHGGTSMLLAHGH